MASLQLKQGRAWALTNSGESFSDIKGFDLARLRPQIPPSWPINFPHKSKARGKNKKKEKRIGEEQNKKDKERKIKHKRNIKREREREKRVNT